MTDPVCEIVGNWPPSLPFDALRAIEAWTGEKLSPSDVAALAIAELVDKDEAGEELDLDTFLDRFPSCREELIHRIGKIKRSVLGSIPRINDVYFGQKIIRYLSLTTDSQVFLTVDSQLKSRVAVLKVTNRSTQEPAFIARLHHEGIVTLYALTTGSDGHPTAFTVEYAGDSFALESIPRDVLFDRLYRVASAVEHMHQRGVIHNDLTSRNIIANDACTKLIDFNASISMGAPGTDRPVGSISCLTRVSLHELLLNERFISVCDDSIDRYAFVVLCYRSLAGELPWAEEISPTRDSIRQLLAKRDALNESSLNTGRLTRWERKVFCRYLRESSPIPKPTIFLGELVWARKKAVLQLALTCAAVLFLVGVLAWGIARPLQSVNTLGASTSGFVPSSEIREEYKRMFESDDVTSLLIACYRDRETLSPKEKAIMAYCIGICHGDRNLEINLGRSVVRSGQADAAVYSNLSLALFADGCVPEAFACVDAAIALDPKCPQALFHKATALASDRDSNIEDVLKATLKILQLLPRELAVQRLSTNVLAKLESNRDSSDEALHLGEQVYFLLDISRSEPTFNTFAFYAKPFQPKD